MNRVLLALLLVPALARGAEGTSGATGAGDPMANWVPPKVRTEAKDKQEIQALLKAMEAAGKAGDLEGAAALVDFPVTMMTDDKKGEGKGEAWTREKWTEVMRPFYAQPMKDMKVAHKRNIVLLSDSLAVVDDQATMTRGGKSITARSSMIVVRKDGNWLVKTMAEGGWGDTMASQGAAASAPQGAPAGQGTGSGAMAPPAGGQGTGSGATAPPAGQGTGTGAQAPAERTTK